MADQTTMPHVRAQPEQHCRVYAYLYLLVGQIFAWVRVCGFRQGTPIYAGCDAGGGKAWGAAAAIVCVIVNRHTIFPCTYHEIYAPSCRATKVSVPLRPEGGF